MHRSALFAADLEWRAKQAARERFQTIEFEYRRRYGLTINDPRFLAVTVEEMLTDIWAHKYHENPKLLEEMEDPDFDPDSVASEIGYQPKPEAGGDLPDDFEDVN